MPQIALLLIALEDASESESESESEMGTIGELISLDQMLIVSL